MERLLIRLDAGRVLPLGEDEVGPDRAAPNVSDVVADGPVRMMLIMARRFGEKKNGLTRSARSSRTSA